MARKIEIYGDVDSASMFFINSTVDPKALGTIVASVKDDEDRIVIQRTDRFESDGVTFRTIFRRLNPRRVCNREAEELVEQLGYSTQDVVDYINQQANLTPNISGGDNTGSDLIGQQICFSLDETNTSIILDNGHHYGVNTIKAVEESGVIKITSIDTAESLTYFTNIEVGNACINNEVVPGGINDVVNALNELFSVGPFESVVISDPFSTMVADVAGETSNINLIGIHVQDPIGDAVAGATQVTNQAVLTTDEIINQPGEYYTFDIKNEGTIGFGLIHTDASYAAGNYSGSATYADPSTFGITNSQHAGFQFSHWFHPTPNGSWTNYGANTSYVQGPGWYNSNTEFEARDEWLAGDPIKIKVGLDENGYIAISTLKDDDATWVLHARTSYKANEGAEFKLGIKFRDTQPVVWSTPKVHLLEEAAPTMQFRYVESPDGVFQYPLFATYQEAVYYDQQNGGSGTYHSHVFEDDPTNTTWYMPDTNAVHNGTFAPLFDLSLGTQGVYTEITTLRNSDLTPSAFSAQTITVDELASVNIQLHPQDVGYVTSIIDTDNSGLTMDSNGLHLQGTAPEVLQDNVTNPSDTYSITVRRTNSYGSSDGILTLVVTNLTSPVVVPINGITHEATSTAMVDSDTLDNGSVVKLDNPLNDGNRLVIDKAFIDNYVLPAITPGSGVKTVYIGFGKETGGSANWADGVLLTDFELAFGFYSDDSVRNANNWRLQVYKQGSAVANVGVGGQTSGLYNYVFVNDGGTIKIAGLLPSYGDASTFVWNNTAMSWDQEITGLATQNREIYIGTSSTTLDLPNPFANFTEVAEPVPPVTNQTPWNKALNFSGGSEYLKQVTQSTGSNALRMSGLSQYASANSDSSKTSSDTYSRPWATAIVFQTPSNTSNQHIWNSGEGASTGSDNIYLRITGSNGDCYFGWGREGGYNEYKIGSFGGSYNQSTGQWWGIYISHDGTRLNAANATPANLVNAFDIRLMATNDVSPVFDTLYDVGNDVNNWTSSGFRMDRAVLGDFTIGGRGANRSFHGKVASMVVTTLVRGATKPTDAEIKLMLTDPIKWEDDYKDGQTARYSYNGSTFTYGPSNSNSKYATQIWLMGDGTSDSYSNGIRNHVDTTDQNYSKLQLNSMVSNDIENVNIPGLT